MFVWRCTPWRRHGTCFQPVTPMKRTTVISSPPPPTAVVGAAILAVLALGACAGTTVRSDPTVDDVGVYDGSVSDSGVPSGSCSGVVPPGQTCFGACPHANGATCAGDCDCCNKCLGGTCAFPTAQGIACGNAAACPTGQTCSAGETCEGAPCTTSDTCPAREQCEVGHCRFFGCI